MQRKRSWPALVLAGLYAAGLCACQQVGRVPGMSRVGGDTRLLTQEELRGGLLQYSNTFAGVVITAADRILAGTRDRTIRRRSLLWKVQMIPIAKKAASLPTAQQSYVASLALAVAMSDYFEQGEGAELFAEHQPIAVTAARELEQDARDLGARFLTEQELDRLNRKMDELVREHPIRGEFSAGSLFEGLTDPETQSSLAWALNVPMAPFRALGGINEGAQAIREFNQIAAQLVDLAADLPRLLRWQLELFLYDFEDRQTTLDGLAAIQTLAESSQDLAATVETLPEFLSSNAPATLRDARATLAQAESALAEARTLVTPLSDIATQMRAAGDSWAAIVQELSSDDEPDPDAHPFDIREYERTAQEIRLASDELKELVVEVRSLAGGPELGTVVGGLEGSGRSLVDMAAWRLLQLILVFFALLFVYRLVSARIGARGA
jgi:hypothetical protein